MEQAITDAEPPEDEENDGDDQRDVLGEMEITARLMITGGEAKEDARLTRPDRAMIRQAIIAAAHTCYQEKRQTLTQDIREALFDLSRDTILPEVRRQRAYEMAESINLFCAGFEGELFNREGQMWPEADITLVDLATFAREGYEAQLAISKMQGYKVSYPVVYDLEYAKASKLSAKTVSEMALTFCNEVRRAGYYPMVYCNTNWYDNYIDWSLLSGVDVWIARYGDTIQAPDKERYNYTIWQSTDGNRESGLNSTSGLVAGIPAGNDVDMDFGYVDYTKKITPRWKSLHSYVPAMKPDTGSNDGSQEQTGLHQENGKYYYVNENGERVSDQWVTVNGKTYYISSDGYALMGMKKVDGKCYWFHTKSGYMFKNRRVTRSTGDIYYFGSDGVRCENGMYKVREKSGEHTYYFRKNGKAYKGWLTLNGKKYYFYKGSSALSGTRAENITLTSSNRIVSVFDGNGVCTRQYKKR